MKICHLPLLLAIAAATACGSNASSSGSTTGDDAGGSGAGTTGGGASGGTTGASNGGSGCAWTISAPISASGTCTVEASTGENQLVFTLLDTAHPEAWQFGSELASGNASLVATTYDASNVVEASGFVRNGSSTDTQFNLGFNVNGVADIGSFSLQISSPGAPASGNGATVWASPHGALSGTYTQVGSSAGSVQVFATF